MTWFARVNHQIFACFFPVSLLRSGSRCIALADSWATCARSNQHDENFLQWVKFLSLRVSMHLQNDTQKESSSGAAVTSVPTRLSTAYLFFLALLPLLSGLFRAKCLSSTLLKQYQTSYHNATLSPEAGALLS